MASGHASVEVQFIDRYCPRNWYQFPLGDRASHNIETLNCKKQNEFRLSKFEATMLDVQRVFNGVMSSSSLRFWLSRLLESSES